MIPVNTPLLKGNEAKYLAQCIETGWISSEGPFVRRFEQLFAEKVGRADGVAVANGSCALDVAVKALEIGPGDEVIMPTFTIISCAGAIIRAGATPVVVDCDAGTWNMTAEGVREKITARTKAIMVVHIYGLPVDMEPILKLALEYGLKIIEDAAEVHGQTYKGKPCGSFGDISTFSFYPNKHVTTGEGGMVMADDPVLLERCRSLRNLCFNEQQRFVHHELGWNYRMSNLQAAVGLAQLEQLDSFILRKRAIGARYQEMLGDLDCFDFAPVATNYADNIYWVFGLVVRPSARRSKPEIVAELAKQKIGTRPFFWPMHRQPVFEKMGLFVGERYPNAEYIAENGFYLPSGLGLSDDDIDAVAKALRAFAA
ncbi:DegT/DnrJ/EryC1/StrS family aminotransferase [Rhizobium sp. PAMB 3174]